MSANDWFLQFQADVLGRPSARAAEPNRRLLRAAFLAAVGSKLIDEKNLAKTASGATRLDSEIAGRRAREETGRVEKSREGGGWVLFGLSS